MAFKALKTNINKTKNLYTTEMIFFTHLLNHKLTLINHIFLEGKLSSISLHNHSSLLPNLNHQTELV